MLPQRMILAGLAAVLGIGVGRGAWIFSQPQLGSTNTLHAVAIAATPATPTPKPPTVRLMLYASPVWVVAPGAADKTEAVNGQEIAVGTKVITGDKTRAAIVYPNGTTTVLDFNSEATLKNFQAAPQKILVELEKNRIWSRVVKLIGDESYQTESNTVVATVRGTSYGHSLTPKGEAKIMTSEGLVWGNCKEKKQNGEIPKGYKTTLNCASDGEVKPKAMEGKDKDEWYTFNDEEVKIDALLRDKQSFDNVEAGDTPAVTPVPSPIPTPTPAPVAGTNQVATNNTVQATPTPRPGTVSGASTAVRATATPTPPPTPVPLPPGEIYIDQVVAVSGPFGACCSDISSDTGVAQSMVTGAPDSPPEQKFIQLADNTVITLKFSNNRVVERPGADLRIDTVDQEFPGTARFEVGVGPDCQNTAYKGVGTYADTSDINIDIASTGYSRVQCVRITDLVDNGDPYPNLGFDIDAVEALHSEQVQ